jgi:nitroimidazol reductase NimA-like FMN-containing flavoprotein (pyridoxamine 5'-phosphate oxidase superfamily)
MMISELNDSEIDEVLSAQQLGRIGCHADGVTYVVPIGYVFESPNVYALAAPGHKIDMMRKNPRVCFEVEEVEHWAHWRTIIAWGDFAELKGEEADAAHQLLHSRMTPLIEFERRLGEYLGGQVRDAPPLIVYRIALSERSGRSERLV